MATTDDTGLSFDDEDRTRAETAARDHAALEEQVDWLQRYIADHLPGEALAGETVAGTAIRLLRRLNDRAQYIPRDEYDAACVAVADAHTRCTYVDSPGDAVDCQVPLLGVASPPLAVDPPAGGCNCGAEIQAAIGELRRQMDDTDRRLAAAATRPARRTGTRLRSPGGD